jgi:hypothetical protein
LLDIASGPVQYTEYLSYSEGYDRRICADISITALKAAKEKLGDKGIYIQCDITRLPLKDASVDGFISLHTIYHVPEKKQGAAFRELERVLMHEKTGVVVYSWGTQLPATKFFTTYTPKKLLRTVLPNLLVDGLKKVFGAQTPTRATDHPSVLRTTNKNSVLYFHAHDYTWFQREIASIADWDVRVWRSVSVPLLQRYVHTKLLGRLLLSVLFRIEDTFPHLFGRFGQYPMMVYRKTKPNTGAATRS